MKFASYSMSKCFDKDMLTLRALTICQNRVFSLTALMSMFFNQNKGTHLHKNSLILGGFVRDTNMAAVPLFRDTNKAAATSLENTLYQIGLSTNRARRFCRTARATLEQTIHPWRAESFWVEKALCPASPNVLHLWTNQYWPMICVLVFALSVLSYLLLFFYLYYTHFFLLVRYNHKGLDCLCSRQFINSSSHRGDWFF